MSVNTTIHVECDLSIGVESQEGHLWLTIQHGATLTDTISIFVRDVPIDTLCRAADAFNSIIDDGAQRLRRR